MTRLIAVVVVTAFLALGVVSLVTPTDPVRAPASRPRQAPAVVVPAVGGDATYGVAPMGDGTVANAVTRS